MSKREGLSPRTRFRILSRDRFTCVYCGRSAPQVELHVDHREAVANGGSNRDANLVTACKECNLSKNAKEITHNHAPISGDARRDDAPQPHPLIGRWGHSKEPCAICAQPRVEWQFCITAVPSDSIVEVQLFSWMGGEPTVRKLIPLERLLSWDLFETGKARAEHWDNIDSMQHADCRRRAIA